MARLRELRRTEDIFPTDKILIAAGAWSQHVGELARVKVPVRPERHEILVTLSPLTVN